MKHPQRDFRSPQELVHYSLFDYIGKRAHEFFVVIYANISGPPLKKDGIPQYKIVGFSEYTSGANTFVAADLGGVFRDALLSNCQALISVHQHPSGIAKPSEADEKLWGYMNAMGEVLSLPILDHLVLGEDEFYSAFDNARTSYARLAIMMPP